MAVCVELCLVLLSALRSSSSPPVFVFAVTALLVYGGWDGVCRLSVMHCDACGVMLHC